MSKLKSELTNRDVIHCPTQELADAVDKLWGKPTCYKGWCNYGKDFCLQLYTHQYCEYNFYKREGFNIISAEDFLKFNQQSIEPQYQIY